MSTHNICFEQEFEKYQIFYLKISLFWLLFSIHLNKRVFVMSMLYLSIQAQHDYVVQ